MSPRVRLPALAGLVLIVAAGCRPTCQEMCRKLERCGLTGEVERRECEESCVRELGDARDIRREDDRETLQAFNERRACVGTTSCDDLAEGACYVEGDAFPWSREP